MRRSVVIGTILLFTFTLSAQKRHTTKRIVVRKTAVVRKKTTPKKTKSAAVYSNASIRGLQNQRLQIQKKIRQQEQALRANQADVKKRLQNLMLLNTEISERQKSIEGIEEEIHHINGNINILKTQLKTLEQQLEERKANYVKSMR